MYAVVTVSWDSSFMEVSAKEHVSIFFFFFANWVSEDIILV